MDGHDQSIADTDRGMTKQGSRPYVIGVTGNIATGKTTVLSMLRHLGARIIDADLLAHEVMAPNTDVWRQIVGAFGREILDEKGAIVRAKLGDVVFQDPEALARLEAIVHPVVIARTERLIAEAEEPVVVVEAIKLIESGLVDRCDTLWVVTCRRNQQMERLVEQRYLTKEQALARVQAQPPQAEKIFQADVVIDNSGSLDETWEQVHREWQKIAALIGDPTPPTQVRRATREDVPAIARFLAAMDWRGKPPNEEATLARIMGRAHWLLLRGNQVVGMASWEALNLVACLEEIVVAPEPDAGEILCKLVDAVEGEARILQCEVMLAILPPGSNSDWDKVYKRCGYSLVPLSDLAKPWREVASEVAPAGSNVFQKSLR